MQPANNLAKNEAMSSLAKRGSNYPQSAERTLFYIHANKSGFQGGNMQVPNGSTLKIKQGALTPPPGWPLTRITLTMVVEKDDAKNELIFTFGPAGCQFNPPAEVWFDWSDLGSSNATLYYIEDDGTYTEQEPEDVDMQGQRIKVYIDHFSRYAIGAE